eukprot:3582016-Rhodomonas_salina.1
MDKKPHFQGKLYEERGFLYEECGFLCCVPDLNETCAGRFRALKAKSERKRFVGRMAAWSAELSIAIAGGRAQSVSAEARCGGKRAEHGPEREPEDAC